MPRWSLVVAAALVLFSLGWAAVLRVDQTVRDVGAASAPHLEFPRGLAVDAEGNVYVADTTRNRVRKVATSGVITTVAGNGRWGYGGDGGPATAASLYGPWGLAVDDAGNLYIADYVNDRIRKVGHATGVMTTVAGGGTENGDGGPATRARLNAPYAVAVDGAGNLFIADADIQRIRRVSASGVIASVLVGGDEGLGEDSPQMTVPTGMAADISGNIYIADPWRNRIRKLSAGTWAMSIIAGTGPIGVGSGGSTGDGGPATGARLNSPSGVALDRAGNLYFVDTDNERIRKISAEGIITTVVGLGRETGDGGLATNAALPLPAGIAVDAAGDLYILEVINHRVRKVSMATGLITSVAR